MISLLWGLPKSKLIQLLREETITYDGLEDFTLHRTESVNPFYQKANGLICAEI